MLVSLAGNGRNQKIWNTETNNGNNVKLLFRNKVGMFRENKMPKQVMEIKDNSLLDYGTYFFVNRKRKKWSLYDREGERLVKMEGYICCG